MRGCPWGAATGPVLTGVLFDLLGQYSTAFAAASAAIFVATLLLAAVRKPLASIVPLRRSHDAYSIKFGRNSASSGKIVRMTRPRNIIIRKGKMPLKIVCSSTSCAIPLMT